MQYNADCWEIKATCSSTSVGSKIIDPLSVKPQQIATAWIDKKVQSWKYIDINTVTSLPARCFRGIPASTSAAHDAFMAHGRS